MEGPGAVHCAAPHLCVHQILAFTLIQQEGANATTTFTRCSSSLSVSTVQRRNSCGIHLGSRPSAMHPPSIALSAWPYATRYETAPFHRLQELTAINLKHPHQRMAEGFILEKRTNGLMAESHIWLFSNQAGCGRCCRIRSTALKQFTSGISAHQLVSDIASKGYIQEYWSGQVWEQGAGSDPLLYKRIQCT